ncbi:MAG: dihydrofolate reductase [Nanobdellota archaeon]
MIAIIAAFPANRVIGKGNELPWKIKGDLKHFKEQTKGKTIIMGRKTFESIGRPLPKRNNIVITSKDIENAGIDVCRSVDEAIDKGNEYDKDMFVIGGASIYEQFLPKADKLYISHIKEYYEGDVYFPDYDESNWEEEYREDKGEFVFVIYRRR